MIATIVIAALACGALAFVAAPMRSSTSSSREPSFDVAELESKKRAALVAIIDIENERDVGKLSSADFAVLRDEYETEAVAALIELDALRGSPGDDAGLEAEIAAIRERLADSHSQKPASSTSAALIACPSCGAPGVPGRACERCGA